MECNYKGDFKYWKPFLYVLHECYYQVCDNWVWLPSQGFQYCKVSLIYFQVETHTLSTQRILCVWTNKIGNSAVISGNLLCCLLFIYKFIFSSPDIKKSYLKSGDVHRKSVSSHTGEFLDSTDRNYYTKLWAKLSSKKSPVVRVGQVG